MSRTIRNLWHVIRNIVNVVIETRWFLHLILGVSIVVDEINDLFVLAVEINVIHYIIDFLGRCLIHILKRNINFFRAWRIQVFRTINGFVDLFWSFKTKNMLFTNRSLVSLLLLLMLVICAHLLPFIRNLVLATLAVRAWSETQVLVFHFLVFVFLGDFLLYFLPKLRVLCILALFGLRLCWWTISFLLRNILISLFVLIWFLLLLFFLLFLLVIRVHFINLSFDLASNSMHRVYIDVRELIHQHGSVETVIFYALPSLSALQLF